MTLARLSLLLAAGCALGAAAFVPVQAAARTNAAQRAVANFDGNWSVLIVTRSGPCDQAYRYGIAIRNGRVSYEGSAPVNVAGSVAPNGVVNVQVWAGSQSANGAGRLARDSGGGDWRGSGSSGSCSGTWSAERR
jgi:hypothetical protein